MPEGPPPRLSDARPTEQVSFGLFVSTAIAPTNSFNVRRGYGFGWRIVCRNVHGGRRLTRRNSRRRRRRKTCWVGKPTWPASRRPKIQKSDRIGGSARVTTAKSAVHAKMITTQLSTTPRIFPTMASPTRYKCYRRTINSVRLPQASHSKIRSSAFSSGWGERLTKFASALQYWQTIGVM